MPRKPTHPFGHVSFSKDGRVVKHTVRLSDDKEEQEKSALDQFLTKRFPDIDFKNLVKKLPERDNDFEIRLPDGSNVIVELIELTRHDYMSKISRNEYHNNAQKYPRVMQSHDEIWSINEKLKDDVVRLKIEKKLFYQKPAKHRFWLLVWSVESEFFYFWHEGGKSYEHHSLEVARKFIEEQQNAFVFDEVWIGNLQLNPRRIWPRL